MYGMTANDVADLRACLMEDISRTRWPSGVRFSVFTVGVAPGRFALTALVTLPGGRQAKLQLGEAGSVAWDRFVASLHATITPPHAGAGRPPKAPLPTATGGDEPDRERERWLWSVGRQVDGCDASDEAKGAAKTLLAAMETARFPTPEIRGFLGASVVAAWKTADGNELEIQVMTDGRVTVSPYFAGKLHRDIRCYDSGRAVRESRKWLGWLTADADGNDTEGASEAEIMALCEVKR